jgi:Family of unknown function (DUF6335)
MTTRSSSASRRKSRRSSAGTAAGRSPRPAAVVSGPPSAASMTALAVQALRAGVVPSTGSPRPPAIPNHAEILCGDPDDDRLANEYVGDETPGGSAPTPDQNDVDEIGRVYGVQEEDSGALRVSSELMAARDRHRAELLGPSRRRSDR